MAWTIYESGSNVNLLLFGYWDLPEQIVINVDKYAMWGLMVVGPIVGSMALVGAGAAGATVVAVGTGLAVGRAAWTIVSRRSGRRVQRLAETLAQAATQDAQTLAQSENAL